MQLATPIRDAAPTTIVMAISMAEKCPLRRWDMPSRYAQITAINKSQNRNKGSPTQEVARERRKPSATPAQSGSV